MSGEGERQAAPKSASKRAKESRAAKLAAGYASKSYLLPPAALADLETLKARGGVSEAEAIITALAQAANAAPLAASSEALDVTAPDWFKPEFWFPKAGSWVCRGAVDPPRPAREVETAARGRLMIDARSWAIRRVETDASAPDGLATVARFFVIGTLA